jgi:hypothetical protein
LADRFREHRMDVVKNKPDKEDPILTVMTIGEWRT